MALEQSRAEQRALIRLARPHPPSLLPSRMEEREAQHKRQREECTHGRGRGEAGHAPEHGGEAADPVPDLGFGRLERDRAKRRRSPGPPRSAGWQRLRRWTGQRDGEAWVPVREGERERERERDRERASARLGSGSALALGGRATPTPSERENRERERDRRKGRKGIRKSLLRRYTAQCGFGGGCRISAPQTAGSNQMAGLLPAGPGWP